MTPTQGGRSEPWEPVGPCKGFCLYSQSSGSSWRGVCMSDTIHIHILLRFLTQPPARPRTAYSWRPLDDNHGSCHPPHCTPITNQMLFRLKDYRLPGCVLHVQTRVVKKPRHVPQTPTNCSIKAREKRKRHRGTQKRKSREAEWSSCEDGWDWNDASASQGSPRPHRKLEETRKAPLWGHRKLEETRKEALSGSHRKLEETRKAPLWAHRKLGGDRKAPLWEPLEGGQCAEMCESGLLASRSVRE